MKVAMLAAGGVVALALLGTAPSASAGSIRRDISHERREYMQTASCDHCSEISGSFRGYSATSRPHIRRLIGPVRSRESRTNR